MLKLTKDMKRISWIVITRVINYNTDSYSERFLHFQKAISCFKTKECSYDKEATTNK